MAAAVPEVKAKPALKAVLGLVMAFLKPFHKVSLSMFLALSTISETEILAAFP